MFHVGSAAVRVVRLADVECVVELGRVVDPTSLSTLETFRALLEADPPPTTERLVAESSDRIVAWAPSGLYDSGVAWFWIGVHPEHRGRGIGSALWGHAEERLRKLGARWIETTPSDENGSRFLTQHGFDVSASVRLSEIDPRTVSAAPPLEDACLEIVALRDATTRAEALFELYSEARADVPSQVPRTPWSFSEWRAETLDHPLLDLDASVVVLDHDEPVSLAWLYSDREGGRAETLMAATRRDRRGHGLATLAKIESTRRAAAVGITRILTGNDIGNGPMLAINRKLGYTPTILIESYRKSLVPR